MQSFKNFRRTAACGVLGAMLAPAMAAAPAAAPSAAQAATPAAAQAAPQTSQQATALAEAQQRLEQAAKDVARLSAAAGGEREVRIIRMQHGGPEGAREVVTTDLEGGPEGMPTNLPAGARIMVIRDGGQGLMDGAQELPGSESIREIRVVRSAAGPQGQPGPAGMPGMRGMAGMHGMPGLRGPKGPGMAHVEVTLDGPLADLELANLSPTLGRYFGADKGVLVVHANDALKLQDGDVLRTIGGRVPTDEHHAMRILGSYAPGEAVKLEVLRDRKKVQLDATLPAAAPGPVKRRVRVQMSPQGNASPPPGLPALPALPAPAPPPRG